MEFVDNEIEMEVIAMAGDDSSSSPSYSTTTTTTTTTTTPSANTKPGKASTEKVQDNEEFSEDEQLDQNHGHGQNLGQAVVDMTVPSLVRKKWIENDMDDHEDNGDSSTKKQTSNEPETDSDHSDTMYIQFTSQQSAAESTFYVQPQFDRIAHMHLPSEMDGAEGNESDEDSPFHRNADHHRVENESHSEDDEIAI